MLEAGHYSTGESTAGPAVQVPLGSSADHRLPSFKALAHLDVAKAAVRLPHRPRLTIYYGGKASLAFMYAPLIQTLTAGFVSKGVVVTVGNTTTKGPQLEHFLDMMRSLNSQDMFVWVGQSMHDRVQWREMRANGVYTVYYQTEPLDANRGCKWPMPGLEGMYGADHKNQAIPKMPAPMHELWDYSLWNLFVCYPYVRTTNLIMRHVPPGFMPATAAAAARSARHPRQLSLSLSPATKLSAATMPSMRPAYFLGGATLKDRAACLKPMHKLVVAVNNVWDDHALARLADGGSAPSIFLNLHQRCSQSGYIQPLETFRLAQLLSVGGTVISQHSYLMDEHLYRDIVTFAALGELPGVLLSRMRMEQHNLTESARARSQLYRQRFAPERIVARASQHSFHPTQAELAWHKKATG